MLKAPPRGVDDGIPPLGPRQSLCCRKGARREVSLRLSREDCHRQSSPTTTSGCRGFESRHANAQQKAPYLSRYGAYLLFKGGRWDSNPRQPEPQSGALPLNYVHHWQEHLLGGSIQSLEENARLKIENSDFFWKRGDEVWYKRRHE